MNPLPSTSAHLLEQLPQENRWLIDTLWAEQGVGIIGGEPKSCKSFLALEMAISVASGAPCLRRYSAAQTGSVLLFAAEDALHIVRQRLEGICRAACVRLDQCDIQVITIPTLRLDTQLDQGRLCDTVAELRPRLLLLDPLVRLHRVDENASHEVAPLLGYLRELQRSYQLAVAVVHHARKGAHKLRPGQALRGSSELHAWGDSNLYLRRRDEQLTLTIEHRAAAGAANIPLALKVHDDELALCVPETPQPTQPAPPLSAAQIIERVLAEAPCPLSVTALRKACRIRTQRLYRALRELQQQGRVIKTADGYRLP